MYNFIQNLYHKFKKLMNTIFETLTMRTPPEYQEIYDDDDNIIYFDNPIRKNK
jgi:hypothetical protein